MQRASGHFQIGQPRSFCISANLVYTGRKFVFILRCPVVFCQACKQFFHTLHFECRAIVARKQFALCHRMRQMLLCNATLIHILIQKCFASHRSFLEKCFSAVFRKIHTSIGQFSFQLLLHGFLVRPRQIHLVDKQKGRNVIVPQEPPECPRVSLHAIGSADNKDCIVEHL